MAAKWTKYAEGAEGIREGVCNATVRPSATKFKPDKNGYSQSPVTIWRVTEHGIDVANGTSTRQSSAKRAAMAALKRCVRVNR